MREGRQGQQDTAPQRSVRRLLRRHRTGHTELCPSSWGGREGREGGGGREGGREGEGGRGGGSGRREGGVDGVYNDHKKYAVMDRPH